MTVTVPSPSLLEGVRTALAATLTTEFEAEGIVFTGIKLTPTDTNSEAAGSVFSMGWSEDPQQVATIVCQFGVQLYDATMTDDWDASQGYDPTRMEQWLHRAALALKVNEHTTGVWFLRVTDAQLDDDPSGNPTHAELIVRAWTSNPFDTPNI